MRKSFTLLSILIFLLLLLILISKASLAGDRNENREYKIEIKDLSKNITVLEKKVREGERVVIGFINSVENKPVFEVYKIEDGCFILESIIYQALYAGYIYSEEVPLTKTITLIPDINESYEKISFLYGWVGNHTIFICSSGKYFEVNESEDSVRIIGEVIIPLHKYIENGEIVEIHIESK